MRSWRRIFTLGFLVWLIPFLVAFLVFPFRESNRALFESIMAVTVTAATVSMGLIYLRRIDRVKVREGILLGLVWFVVCVAVDAPLMLLGGPMKMTFWQYMADIGLTYIIIPVVTWGLAVASAGHGEKSSDGPGE